MAGITEALIIVTPFEVVKIRLQQQKGLAKEQLKYKVRFACFMGCVYVSALCYQMFCSMAAAYRVQNELPCICSIGADITCAQLSVQQLLSNSMACNQWSMGCSWSEDCGHTESLHRDLSTVWGQC